MLKAYEIRPATNGYRSDDRSFVIADNPTQAKALVHNTQHSKMGSHNYDWIDLRVRRIPELDYIIEEDKITSPTFLFDNETYEDHLDEERRWWYANQ